MNGRTNVISSGNDSLGGIIPLEAPNTFVVVADNAKCLLSWVDPKDKYADELGEITDEGDQLVSQFAFTRIVRKEGSAPGTPDDGVIVTVSSTRNQYQSTQYIDEGLTNNIEYFYAAFTCNTDGVWSGANVQTGLPRSYDPILANNSWEQINDVANTGFASSVWEIGDIHTVTVNDIPGYFDDPPHTSELECVIIAFNDLDLTDGTGKNAITFAFTEVCDAFMLLDEGYVPDPSIPGNTDWNETDVANVIKNEIIAHIDPILANMLVEVTDYACMGSMSFGSSTYLYWYESTYSSKIIGFTPREIFGNKWPDDIGISGAFNVSMNNEWIHNGDEISNHAQYPYFSTVSNRICRFDPYQNSNNVNYCTSYWYRKDSPVRYSGISCNDTGALGTHDSYMLYVRPGFCIGKVVA